MDVKIRPASKDDVPKIVSILNDAFNSPLNLPDDYEYIEDPSILALKGLTVLYVFPINTLSSSYKTG